MLVAHLRISAGFTGDSFREKHLWEHFGRTDKIALITCLKKLGVFSPHLPCEIAEANFRRFWMFFFLPDSCRLSIQFDRFSVTFNPFHYNSALPTCVSSAMLLYTMRNTHMWSPLVSVSAAKENRSVVQADYLMDAHGSHQERPVSQLQSILNSFNQFD